MREALLFSVANGETGTEFKWSEFIQLETNMELYPRFLILVFIAP